MKDKLSSGSARFGLEAVGDDAPEGPILGARVEHLGAKGAARKASSSNRAACFAHPPARGLEAVSAVVQADGAWRNSTNTLRCTKAWATASGAC